MQIDVRHIAKLSRLRLEEDEAERFEREMLSIVSMVENIPPLEDTGALIDPEHPMELRDDVPAARMKRELLLQNAPQTQAGCVVVPKVVE